jgi:hypothetical protein
MLCIYLHIPLKLYMILYVLCCYVLYQFLYTFVKYIHVIYTVHILYVLVILEFNLFLKLKIML